MTVTLNRKVVTTLLFVIMVICIVVGMISAEPEVAHAEENVVLNYTDLHLTWTGFEMPTEGGDPYRVDSPETATSLIGGLVNANIPYDSSLTWYTYDDYYGFREYCGLMQKNYLPFDGGTVYYLKIQIAPNAGYEFNVNYSLTLDDITFNNIRAAEFHVGSSQINMFFPMPITAGEAPKLIEGYHAKIHDIEIPEEQPGYYDTSLVRKVFISNTGTEELGGVKLTWKNPTDYFVLRYNSVLNYIYSGTTNSTYYVYPVAGLAPGTYSATLVLSATNLEDVVEATVSFSVAYDHEHITELRSSVFGHWYECTVPDCNYKSNIEEHDSNVTKNQAEADFENNGYTGDKHCSVCDFMMQHGEETCAFKYIRSSSGAMTPANISSTIRPNDLVFTSSEPSKYQIALSSVYDKTDEALNTSAGKYPLDSYFVEDHLYVIFIEFNAVGDYEYDEFYFTSTFAINGAPVDMASYTSLSGSTSRQLLQTATGIPLTFTDNDIYDIPEGNGNVAITPYSVASAVSGGSEPYAFRKYSGADWIDVAEDGTVSGTRANIAKDASLLVVEVTDSKGATQHIVINVGKVNHVHIAEGEWKYDEVQHYKQCGCGERMNVAAHEYDEGTVKYSATHTAAGTMIYECQVCRHEKTETIPAKVDEHTFSNVWSYNDDIHWHASSCGHSVRQDEAPHSWNEGVITTEPTHTTFGERTRYCVCGASKTEQIEKTAAHEYGDWQQHNESQHKRACDCGDIEYQAHDWNDWVETLAATDTTSGTKERTCKVCAHKETATIPMLAHEHSWATEYSNNDGFHWYACGGCDEKKDESAHVWGDGNVTTEPTHTAKGVRTFACVCGATKTEDEPMLTEHTYGDWQSDGDKHWKKCECGDKTQESAHTFGWITDVEPQFGVEGKKHEECSVCGYARNENTPIPALAHEHKTEGAWQYDATNHWRNCDVCEERFDFAVHTFGEWTVTKPATTTEKGEETRTCVCGYAETREIEKSDASDQPEKEGLSGGAIAGIVIGGVIVVGLGGFAIFWFVIKKKKIADIIAIIKK